MTPWPTEGAMLERAQSTKWRDIPFGFHFDGNRLVSLSGGDLKSEMVGEFPSALEFDLHLRSVSAKGRLESESNSLSLLNLASAVSEGDLLLCFASCAAFLLRFHFIRRF